MRFLFFKAGAAKYRFLLVFSRQCKGSRNIVLVVTVDRTDKAIKELASGASSIDCAAADF
jgi:hypothetical protein